MAEPVERGDSLTLHHSQPSGTVVAWTLTHECHDGRQRECEAIREGDYEWFRCDHCKSFARIVVGRDGPPSQVVVNA